MISTTNNELVINESTNHSRSIKIYNLDVICVLIIIQCYHDQFFLQGFENEAVVNTVLNVKILNLIIRQTSLCSRWPLENMFYYLAPWYVKCLILEEEKHKLMMAYETI